MKRKILAGVLTAFVALLCIWIGITYFYVASKFKPVPYAVPSTAISPNPLSFSSVVALHQVNTLKRLESKSKRYNGFEIDIFYMNDFYVGHDEETLSDLTLSDMLSTLKNPANTYLWLDLKNVPAKESNLPTALKTLLQQYNIPVENVVIEAIPDAAKILSRNGFYTAIHACCFDENMPAEETEKLVKRIEENARQSGASALSAGINGYTFVRQYFPEMDKIVYYSKTKVPGFKRHLMTKKVLKDSTVKMFLVDEY